MAKHKTTAEAEAAPTGEQPTADQGAPATGGKSKAPGKKTVCPVTRQQFREEAAPALFKIGNEERMIDLKEFSTGSLGWYFNDKLTMYVGGKPVKVQAGINLTIVGSKELPADQ